MKTRMTWIAAILCAALVGLNSATAQTEEELKQLGTLKSFIGVMQSYVEFSADWLELIGDEGGLAFMVAEGIAEIHEEQGDPLAAIPSLRDLAGKYPEGSTARNAVHFKIKDIYKEAGQFEKALKELEAIAPAK